MCGVQERIRQYIQFRLDISSIVISFIICPNLVHLFLERIKCKFESRARESNLELCKYAWM
jgi:hypothetical protein